MNASITGILVVIVAYLIFMIVIGYYCSKKTNDVGDFFLGGRKLGPIVTAMSAEASDMSSWLLMGLPGVAYLSGIADAGWTAIGLAIGTYLNWLIVAKRLRRYTVKAGNAITLPEFFSNRYRDKSHVLMAISFVPYTASGFAACGKLFSTLFDIPYIPAMLFSAVIIVAYTALGGFLAATAVHTGSYDTMVNTHMMLLRWINQNGYEVNGNVSEEFLVSPIDILEQKNQIIKVIMPVRKV